MLMLSCHSSKQQKSLLPLVTIEEFDKEGHRGCRGLMPENTIPAMLRAIDLGITTLEMDIVFTKDSVPILSHEPFFNHEITTLPDGSYLTEENEKQYNIFQMNYADVVKYDVGMKPHPRFPNQEKLAAVKPSLAEVFDAVNERLKTARRPPLYFNIETKTTPETDNIYHPEPSVFVEKLLKLIEEKDMISKVIIQSFDIRTLIEVHKRNSMIPLALLIEENEANKVYEKTKQMGFVPNIVSPHYKQLNAKLIYEWHESGMRVIPWTVNSLKEMKALREMGVDGIITDYPDILRELN